MKKKTENPATIISRLIRRDGLACHWCKNPCNPESPSPFDPRYPTIEHLIPRSRGGKTQMTNLAVACYECNKARGPGWRGEDLPDPMKRFSGGTIEAIFGRDRWI